MFLIVLYFYLSPKEEHDVLVIKSCKSFYEILKAEHSSKEAKYMSS